MYIPVTDRSHVAEARRLVCDYAREVGIAPTRVDEVSIIATELATNLVKHAGGGHLHLGQFDDVGGTGLEALALDRGPGMEPERCMEDGYSTSGSPGTGLGAMARLSDDMRIYSRPGLGSALMARVRRDRKGTRPHMELSAVLAPYPGEEVCGDSFSVAEVDAGQTIMLVDGSGHGIEAARAAAVAVQSFTASAGDACEEIVAKVHRALAPTRGAAIAVARIDAKTRAVRFVGVGNINAVGVDGTATRHLVSHNGTAGHVAPRIREFSYELAGDPLVILHSDGLTSRWDLAAYPGLARQHPSLIAGVLLRDHRRGRDDASVVVMRAVR